MTEDTGDVTVVSTPEQFKALGHPMRHRLLFALGHGEATISQLAVALASNKGNIAHHLRVLADAGLVQQAGTRTVRGGTEQYYQRTARALSYTDPATTETAFRALAADIATAEPDPFLVLRYIRLSPGRAAELLASLRSIAGQPEEEHATGQNRYGLLLGLYQPAQPPPAGDPRA
jgi:DNA-binding transcriptional ArsR family regulator